MNIKKNYERSQQILELMNKIYTVRPYLYHLTFFLQWRFPLIGRVPLGSCSWLLWKIFRSSSLYTLAVSRDLVHVNIIGQYLLSYLPKNVIWTRVKNWITSFAHVQVRIPTTDPTPLPGLTVNWWKRTTLILRWGSLGMRFLRSQLWCIAKLIFMHGVRSLYTFLYWVSIFQSKSLLLRNQVPT